MANYQALVDAIKNALTFSDMTAPEVIRALAEQYAQACRELNKRMSYCSNYLHEGNIAEAIRLAEIEPNLLDTYNTLDFDERNEWADVAATLAFPVPPPLMVSFVRELNDAYNAQQPLEPYLKKYRLAALARASLAERLAILRAIAQRDPNNITWVKDQETLEKIRVGEIETETTNAIRSNNFSQLIELQTECQQNWSITLPASIREKIDTTVRRYQLSEVTRQMQTQAELLLQAHREFNIEKGKLASENIQTLQEWNHFSIPEPIVEMTRDAVNWLQEEQKQSQLLAKFGAAQKKLQFALQKKSSQEELSRLYHALEIAAKDAMVPVTAEVARAFNRKREVLERQRKRRLQLIIAVIVLFCVVGASTAILLNMYFSGISQTRQTIATLNRLHEEAVPVVIREYLAANENQLLQMKNEEINKRVVELSRIVNNDDERLAEFEAKKKTLDESLKKGETTNRLLLEQLGKLASGTQEKLAVETLRDRLQKIEAERKNTADSKMLNELSRVQKEIQSVLQNKSIASEDRLSRYKLFVLELEKIKNDSTGASKLPLDRCQKMTNELREQISLIDAEISMQGRVATLLPLVGNPELFKNRLKEIVDHFASKGVAKQIGTAYREFPAAEALLKYGEYSRLLQRFQFDDESAPGDAEKLTQLYDESFAKFPSMSNRGDRVISFLRAVAKRPKTLQEYIPLFSGTRETLTRIKSKPVWALFSSPTTEWYYVTEKPDRPRSYNYLTDLYETPVRKAFGDSYFQNAPKNSLPDYTTEALAKLNGINQKNWTMTCVSLVRDIVESDGVDPLLKYTLLKTMIPEFADYDIVFAKYFEPFQFLLIDQNLDTFTHWMDAESSETQIRRATADAVISRITLPGIEKIKSDISFYENIRQTKFDHYEWVGFLNKTETGWKCECVRDKLDSGELYTARMVSANGSSDTFELIQIGNITPDGKIELFDNPKMLQGTPVFLSYRSRYGQ